MTIAVVSYFHIVLWLIFSEWWKNNIYKNIEFCYSCVSTLKDVLGKQLLNTGVKNVPEWYTLANLLGREYSAVLWKRYSRFSHNNERPLDTNHMIIFISTTSHLASLHWAFIPYFMYKRKACKVSWLEGSVRRCQWT